MNEKGYPIPGLIVGRQQYGYFKGISGMGGWILGLEYQDLEGNTRTRKGTEE
jgi:hypothetical protein